MEMRAQIDGQLFSYLAYLFSSLLIATAAGTFCLSKARTIYLPRQSCFLLGFSSGPYIIGVYMLILSFLPFKIPRLVTLLAPCVVALATLFVHRHLLYRSFNKFLLNREFNIFEKTAAYCWTILLYFALIYKALPFNSLKAIYGASKWEALFQLLAMMPPIILAGIVLWVWKKQLTKKNAAASICELEWNFTYKLDQTVKHSKRGGLKASARCVWYLSETVIVFVLTALLGSAFLAVRACLNYFLLESVWPIGLRYFVLSIIVGVVVFIIISIFYFVFGRSESFPQMWKKVYRIFALLMAILTLFILFREVLISSYSPVIGSDASEYLSAALRFAQNRQFQSITLFQGTPDGSLIPLMHHPAWITYLGNALLHTPTRIVGAPVDFAARLAFQMTYVYLFAAIAACARAFAKKTAMFLAMIFPLSFALLSYVYTSSSRDAFRLIPVVLLPAVLLSAERRLHKNTLAQKKSWTTLLTPFWVGSMVMMGHPINALAAVSVVLAFSIYLLCKRRLVCKSTIYLYLATALGALSGSFQMIWSFLSTGSLMGKGYDAESLLQNTPYLNNFLMYSQRRLKGTTNYPQRLEMILTRDYGVLSVTAVVVSVIVVMALLVKRARTKKPMQPFGFLSLVVVCNSILLTDIVRWSNTTLTQWCVMNVRYTFQLYLFWGLFLAVVIVKVIDRTSQIKNVIAAAGISIALMCYTVLPLASVSLSMPHDSSEDATWRYIYHEDYTDQYAEARAVEAMQPEKRALIDNFYANYYFDNQCLTWLSEKAGPIRRADTLDTLDQALSAQNIGTIILTASHRDVYWQNTVLEEYVQDSNYVTPINEEGEIWVYMRNKKE